jgi:hypothetical protein
MRRTHARVSVRLELIRSWLRTNSGTAWPSLHGLGVNLDVYTVAGLDQRLLAVNTLEQSLAATAIN